MCGGSACLKRLVSPDNVMCTIERHGSLANGSAVLGGGFVKRKTFRYGIVKGLSGNVIKCKVCV